MSTDLNLKLLRARVKPDHDRSRAKIEEALRFLKHKIDRTLEDLAAGQGVDEHLIQNATGITHDLIHYNVSRDLLPYLEEEK
jgi:hypothetical protein